MNEKTHPKWNYEEFISFLLLYAAHADMEYSEPEKQYILQRIDSDHYEKILNEYKELNDYEILNTIESYRGLYFPTSDRKEEILNRAKLLFEADGDYTEVEKNIYRLLHRIL